MKTGASKITQRLFNLDTESKLIRVFRVTLTHSGWFILVSILLISFIVPKSRMKWDSFWGILILYAICQITLFIISKIKIDIYESQILRFIRIQVALFLCSLIIYATSGAFEYYWFLYLWPISASVLYFKGAWIWLVFGEVTIYFLASTLLGGVTVNVTSISFFFLHLMFLLILTLFLQILISTFRKNQLTQREINVFENLHSIQQRLDELTDLREVLQNILLWSIKCVSANDGSLMLIEGDGKLHYLAHYGDLFPNRANSITLKPGGRNEGIAGMVARSGKPYICNNCKTDSFFRELIPNQNIGSLVSVPIISHGAVLGVINVDSEQPYRFSPIDAGLLSNIASQVGRAIERAEFLDSIRQLGERSIPMSGDPYQQIVDVAHRLTRSPIALWRVDENKETATLAAYNSISTSYPENSTVNLDDSVTGKAILTRSVIQIPDIQMDPLYRNKELALREGWKSMLSVPLIAGPNTTIGALSIYSRIKVDNYDIGNINILQSFASHAGVIILYNDLIRELRERNNHLEALNRIGQATYSLGVESIGKLIFEETTHFMEADNFFMCIVDNISNKFNFIFRKYHGKTLSPFTADGPDLVRKVICERRSLLIENKLGIEGAYPEIPGENIELQKSWLGVPLLVGENAIGLIAIQSPKVNVYSKTTQLLLQSIAIQAAIAIQNADSYDLLIRKVGELVVLNEIGESISSSTESGLNDIFELIYKQTSRLMDTANFYISLYHPINDLVTFELVYENGKKTAWKSRIEGKGLTEYVISTRKPLLIKKHLDMELVLKNVELIGRDAKSWLGVPMLHRDKIIGVIAVQNYESEYIYDNGHLEVLQTIASQAAIAIENARLLVERKTKLTELLAIYRNLVSISFNVIDLSSAATFPELTEKCFSLISNKFHADTALYICDKKNSDLLKLHGCSSPIMKKGLITSFNCSRNQDPIRKSINKDNICSIGFVTRGRTEKMEGYVFIQRIRNSNEPAVQAFSEYEKNALSIISNGIGHALQDLGRNWKKKIQS